MEDFELTSLVQNGYFYTFKYDAVNKDAVFDAVPFILCLVPSEKHPNVFAGLNLHKLPLSDRIQFLVKLDKEFSMKEGDNRIEEFMLRDLLKTSMPVLKNAIRWYNRMNMADIYRVKSGSVGKYIDYDGYVKNGSPSDVMNKYWLNYYKTETAEAQEKDPFKQV